MRLATGYSSGRRGKAAFAPAWYAWSKTDAGRHTLGYYSLFICLGLNIAVIGPTLPALAAHTHTLLSRMGWLFLAGAVGQTLGTAAGGRVFDRVQGHPLLGIAQLVSAALIFLVPSIPWFWLLLAILVCKGAADGLVNTGANTLLVWTHEEKVGPYMNGLHFCFGLGAFVAPLFVAQVIGVPGGYRWAYWAVGAIAGLAGLGMLSLRHSHPPRRDMDTGGAARIPIYYPLVVAATLYLFFYVGAELSFAGWIYTYAVTLKLAGIVEAAYLTSAFWLSFTMGRLISIPMAAWFKPKQIILTDLIASLSMLVVAILLPGSSLALWVVVIGLGFCMAPLWPTGYTLAGESLNLTAFVSGIILLGDSCGAMVLPWLVGAVLGAAGPRAMVYLVFGSLVCDLLAFAAMLRLRPCGKPQPTDPRSDIL